MNLPKGTAARIAGALAIGVLVGTWVAPAVGAAWQSARTTAALAGTGAPSASASPGAISGRLPRGPDALVPATSSPPASAPASALGASATPTRGPATNGGASPGSAASASTPRGETAPRETTYTATLNWSGEEEAGSAITSVSGSWTVPAVPSSPNQAMVSTWVGIGGLSTTAPLIQAGTLSAVKTGGVTYYTAWYEMLPFAPYTVTTTAAVGGSPTFTIRAGDVMDVSITNVTGETWQIVIEDETAGWRYEQQFRYRSTEASAEWISERPADISGDRYVFYTLPDYGTSRFTNMQVTRSHGTPVSPTTLVAIAMYDTTGVVISAPGPVSPATGTSFTDHYLKVPSRVFGATADGTAAAELTTAFSSVAGDCPGPSATTRAVVLATDASYADALASSYLASVLGTGTLLTAPTGLTTATLEALRDEGITRVYVVGGTLAVSPAVVGQLKATHAYACGGDSVLADTQTVQVSRIGGATSYDTAAMIAEAVSASGIGSVDVAGAYAGMSPAGGDGLYNTTAGAASTAATSTAAMRTAVLATGADFQDAESASTLAYADRLPILLTTPTALSAQAKAALADLGIEQVIVMGGPAAISNAVAGALQADGYSVLRIAGADGTQTAVELAECELGSSGAGVGFGWPATGGVAVARGNFYADGLAGAVIAADGPSRTSPEPLLLTESPNTPGPYLGAFLSQAGTTGIDGKAVTHLTILGGPFAVTPTVANTLSLDLIG